MISLVGQWDGKRSRESEREGGERGGGVSIVPGVSQSEGEGIAGNTHRYILNEALYYVLAPE